jgi:hypothetical protein
MQPTKTQIVCKDNRRRRTYPTVKFDFLGYQFTPRRVATSQRSSALLFRLGFGLVVSLGTSAPIFVHKSGGFESLNDTGIATEM